MSIQQLQVVDPAVGTPTAVVVPFMPRTCGTVRLTLGDRMDVSTWREQAGHCGYDRLVVHERTAMDPPEVQSFLSIYRRGEPWARWGVARSGGSVLAWCSLSGVDVGRFASVAEALTELLCGEGLPMPPALPGATIIHAFN